MTRNTLQITLQHRDDSGWPVSATLKETGGLAYRREGHLQLGNNWETELRSLTLQPDRYGEYLGKALFHECIRDICKDAISDSESARLYLVIEAPELQSLRWERLHYLDHTDTWTSLAQDQQLLFSYYTPSLSSRDYAVLHQRDLRALALICSPQESYQGFQPFDTEVLAEQLADSFSTQIPHTILHQPADATWPNLLERLNAEPYPLLHIVAHGYYDEEREESYLLLRNAEQYPQLVSARTFIHTLKHINRLPHLIFLSSCETAVPTANTSPHGHFARQVLDQWGTPAVIAMSDKVSVQTATTLADAFYPHLYREAQVDLALAKAGLALQQRADRHMPVLYQRLADTPLFGTEPKRISELNLAEREHGLERLQPLIAERAPSARQEFEQLAGSIRTAQPEHEDLQILDKFCQEIAEVSFAALSQDAPLTDYNTECPFPGMRPFHQSDTGDEVDYRKYFFGRTRTVNELLTQLAQESVLGVVGASGSGKSSLIFAGVIPQLEQQAQQQGHHLQVINLRPSCRNEQAGGQVTPSQHLQQRLQELDSTHPAIVYVDQFEELFTLCQFADKAYQEKIRKDFLQTLLGLPARYPLLKVIFTIRDDFIGDAFSYPALKAILRDHAFPLARMNAAELRTAIEQQAEAVGLVFEQGLAHRILSEVEGEPGAMPLLQHLLWRLWQQRRGRYLRTAAYETIGGVKKAISDTANCLFQQYQGNTSAQRYLRNIFLRLTRPGRETQQDTSEHYRDTRQRVPKASLYPSRNEDKPLIDTLIKQLTDKRLIVTYKDDVEIAHESLITYWDTLRDWLKDRQFIEMQQGLSDATRIWTQARLQKSKYADDLLIHRGSRIKKIQQQATSNRLFLNNEEQNYLQACQRREVIEKNRHYLKNLSYS